ncbi:MAG: phosphoribosyltransferase family protein [Dermatophilaceae bacterium]
MPVSFPRTWASAPYEGAIRRAIVAYKDEGRRDAADVLAPLLREAVVGAVGATVRTVEHGLWVVAVPTSSKARARRGDAPLEVLARRATFGVEGLVQAPWALAVRRGVADQAGLDHRARAANLSRAMRADPASAGRTVVLVDDVVTTGATLAEAARALRDVGCSDVVAACVAATRRRTTDHRDRIDRAREDGTEGMGHGVWPPARA